MKYKNLFQPGKIGELTVKNRIVMPAMMLGFCHFDGTPTQRLTDYYAERAKGGVGLIISEIARVNDQHGAGAFAQMAISQDYHIKPLAEMVKKIHAYDCKFFVQLHHPGRQSYNLTMGTLPLAIQAEKSFGEPARDFFYKMTPTAQKMSDCGLVFPVVAPSKCSPDFFTKTGKIRAFKNREIKSLVKDFIQGAQRAQKAGCDGVELHGTHGYLIQQFLSPYTNKRTDEYGGSLENRMRFVLEIIDGIQKTCGKTFPICVRLTVDECYDRIGMPGVGYGLEEGLKIAKRLEEAGIQAINVSSGGYDTMCYWLEPVSFELGWRANMAKAVKKEVNIPVIAANLIRSPQQAEKQLKDGVQDFVALGRPNLADPQWSNKAKNGRERDISRCINCLWCIESMVSNAWLGEGANCAVNPKMGRERLFENIKKDGNGRPVVVVGAGPAGLATAEILAERGFDVTVLEKENHVGGQIYLGARPPHKERTAWCYEDLKAHAEDKGVKIRLSEKATKDKIDAFKPVAVFIATGAQALKPASIPGIDKKNVYTPEDILKEAVKFKEKRILVVGSGMTGLETAEYLAVAGNKVIVIEMASEIAPGAFSEHLDDILPRLRQLGVPVLVNHKLESIEDDGVFVSKKDTLGEKFALDAIVLSIGSKPENALYKEIKNSYENVYLVGDSNKIGRVGDATLTGTMAALSLQ